MLLSQIFNRALSVLFLIFLYKVQPLTLLITLRLNKYALIKMMLSYSSISWEDKIFEIIVMHLSNFALFMSYSDSEYLM